jgi:DNA-binding transcriptional MerR regulator
VSNRTYLSIGDVLTLLREEFPDVTISKIRFLESQGLVNPERSPSGYRKFFEHDVERLRWVLRQQREHFLPLKVIRDRLADGDLDDTGPDVANGKPAHAGRQPAAVAAPAAAEEQPTKADEEAMARILADASRRTARMPEAPQPRRGLQVVGGAEVPVPVGAEPDRERVAASTGQESGSRVAPASAGGPSRTATPSAAQKTPTGGRGAGNGTSVSRPAAETAAGPRTGPVGAEPPSPKGPAATGGGAGATTPNPAPATSPGVVTGASLTREELCAASGLSTEAVAGLEGFGLIQPITVAGIQTYDEDALTLANLAAAFGVFGIEARHLRLYRNAVDREMGLIEQVVIPLLRQRNPESRQRAIEGAEQLAALGQSMRATLLRQALRQHLGG